MPHIDKRSGAVVIRIVYDGAPEAGKTTNVKRLGDLISLQRKGVAKSPGTSGDRTEYFDWLDFSGGYLDGRRVQCQLVSVPGQANLLHRRKYLLETADAIVFVSDSRRELLDEAFSHLLATSRILESIAELPVGVVWQANKQDLPEALTPEQVVRTLRIPKEIPVVGSVADRGEGVMQTFVLAARLATDRVRTLLLNEALPDLSLGKQDPDALHAELIELEERLQKQLPQPSMSPVDPNRASPKRRGRLTRTNRVGNEWPELPNAGEIASGHVWPPVLGRAWFERALSGNAHTPELVRPWAPLDALEWSCEGAWTLHTTQRWLYQDESEAWHKLMAVVRSLSSRPEAALSGRALAIARDGVHFRMWLVTPTIESIAECLTRLLSESDLESSLRLTRQLLEQLRADEKWRRIPAGLRGVVMSDDGLKSLVLDEEGAWPVSDIQDPLDELSSLLDENEATGRRVRERLNMEGVTMFHNAMTTD